MWRRAAPRAVANASVASAAVPQQLQQLDPAAMHRVTRSLAGLLRGQHVQTLPCGGCRLMSTSTSSSTKKLFQATDPFAPRHLGPSKADVEEMCKVIGVKDVEDLMNQAIPAAVRRELPDSLPDGTIGEAGALALAKSILEKNIIAKNFIGMGYHGSLVPSVVVRNVLENPGWYTAYTPYQAEISQGRLESLVNFQTLVSELTGMEVSNSSLLDEGSAAAEAMAMIMRTVNNKSKNQFFVSDKVHPQSIDMIKLRAKYLDVEVVVGDHTSTDFKSSDKFCGALVQYPDTEGVVHDFSGLAKDLHSKGAHMVVSADPLALMSLKPPSEFGADIVVGTMQRFGVPMYYGGPSAAFLATSKKQIRRMPGRIIGESLDRYGNPAYRLTLQTREQHIRLDKATSNVCTAQVLLANMSAMYAIYHRTDGLKTIAQKVHGLAQLFTKELGQMGVATASATKFFDTVTFAAAPLTAATLVEKLQGKELNLRVVDEGRVAASFDESHMEEDVLQHK